VQCLEKNEMGYEGGIDGGNEKMREKSGLFDSRMENC